jgi:hypothetical protein
MYYTQTVLAIKRERFTREPPLMVCGILFADRILSRSSLPLAIFVFLNNPISRIYHHLLLNINRRSGLASLERKLKT